MAFLEKLDLAHTSVGVIAHADKAQVVLRASQNATAISKAIDHLRIGMVGGGNRKHPFDEVESVLARVSGPRFVVALADGMWSDQREAVTSAKSLHHGGVEIIAIGFGGADKKFLREIASCEEGSFFTTVGGLVDTFSSIASVITQTGGDTSTSVVSAAATATPAASKGAFWGLLGGKR
jgi:UDP-N-acetyl-D-mannosaminuronic acid transferase (WecB/TagA/CpsF family)